MERVATGFLQEWLVSIGRKPLVIRGARQVGKTWLIRHLAKISGRKLIELNLEKRPELAKLFSSNDPAEIIERLSLNFGVDLDQTKILLFLDEIQAAPELFAKLRWFAEDMPDLPVIAAGSLLEFLLHDHNFSMPVGRISYVHLEPLSFEEFLLAQDKSQLYKFIAKYTLEKEIPETIHEQLLGLFKEYIVIGGMPAAVATWIKSRSLPKIHQVQQDLLATYRDDFGKYGSRIPQERLAEVMHSTPRQLGQKFTYSRVNAEVHPESVKRAVTLLNRARVCHSVISTAANGVPLAAETKDKFFKEILLDTGLCCASLGISLHEVREIADVTLANNGGLAEQVVGQMLRTIGPFYMEPALYYWHREEKNAQAELDYLIQFGSKIVPVEVKAGASGKMKSLRLFMKLKGFTLAVRVCSAAPKLSDDDFRLISLPFYLVGQLPRLLALYQLSGHTP